MTVRPQTFLVLVFFLGFPLNGWSADLYDYPISDPYLATIMGTPPEFRVPLPLTVRVKELSIEPQGDRPIPHVFWYHNRLRYALAYQKGPAPLIFLIAGTGGDHNGTRMLLLQRIFFHRGFHVISLPSPTHPNFIVTSSTTGVPGDLEDDSRDLYDVMKRIWQDVQKRIEVTDFYLTGYSLGAAESAFIAQLDEQEACFNFKKVLMINPPVSLFNSVTILDNLLESNIPGGPDNFNAFYDTMMAKFADIYKTMDQVDFDDDFLYAVMKQYQATQEELAALIGLAFRFFLTNMIFTSDVATHAGFIVPKNRELSPYGSLTDYFKACMRTTFVDYFNNFSFPYFRAQEPELTRDELVYRSSLNSIENYLRASSKIGLVTNEDDPIYAPGEVDFLRQVFGSRARIYPRGGHCGNMAHRDNVEYMVNFFSE